MHLSYARTPERLPVVLSREEVDAILAHLAGMAQLFVMLLYGSGLRLEECLNLRVKDIDFDRHQIVVRQGKGQKERATMLPASAREPLTRHLADVQQLHARDLARGFGRVVLRFALERKFPSAPAEWRWPFVFSATRICRDPRFGLPSRYHLHESVIQRHWRTPRGRRGSRSAWAHTRCATPSRPVCSKRGTTFARSRNSSGI